KGTLDCSQSRGTWCTAPAALPRRAGSRSPVRGSADDSVQRVLELLGLVRRQLDDEAPAALQRDPHDDAAALLGDLHRTITGPRLPRRHAFSPFIGNTAGAHRGTREPVRDGGPGRGLRALVRATLRVGIPVPSLSRVYDRNGNDRTAPGPPAARNPNSKVIAAAPEQGCRRRPPEPIEESPWPTATAPAAPPKPSPTTSPRGSPPSPWSGPTR